MAFLFCLKSGRSLASSLLASVTFPSAVYCGKRLKLWNTSPKCSRLRRTSASRRVAGSSASKSTSPLTAMLPASGVSRKLRHLSSVVLPLPEEPIMLSACPSSREKLMSFKTLVLSKCFSRFLTSSMDIAPPPYLKNSSLRSSLPSRKETMPLKMR